MKKVLGVAALAMLAGCIHLAEDPWLQEGDVVGLAGPKSGSTLADAWRGESDPWADARRDAGEVIGGDSAFEKGTGAAAARAAAAGTGGLADVAREVEILSARVDRLERLAESGAAGAAAPASAPTVEIYKVTPNGQTAWIAVGARGGVQEGQTLKVTRDGQVVAQATVSRVWPDVSELTVLWANDKLKRGDAVAVR